MVTNSINFIFCGVLGNLESKWYEWLEWSEWYFQTLLVASMLPVQMVLSLQHAGLLHLGWACYLKFHVLGIVLCGEV